MTIKKVSIGATMGATLGALAMGIAVPQIEQLEGTRTAAYRDIVNVLTICTGHTGPDVTVGQVYTKDQCTKLTMKDAEKAASGVLKVSPHLLYHPIQLASAISFTFNVGVGAYSTSSVARDFNSGNFVAGCTDMAKWTYAGGKVSPGLVNRRAQEIKLCLSTLSVEGMKTVEITN